MFPVFGEWVVQIVGCIETMFNVEARFLDKLLNHNVPKIKSIISS